MDQLMKMAGDAGMNSEQSQAATGGVMNFLKQNMGDDFNKISEKVDGADDAAKKYEESATKDASGGGMGGMMGSLTKMAGGAGGGGAGGVAGLLATLQSKGVDSGSMGKFMPQVTGFIQKQSGVDVSSALGGAGAGDASGGGGGNPMAALGGMFGKK